MDNKIQFPTAIESDVAVPMKPPYVFLPEAKADAVLEGKVEIKFPKQCAWCGSEVVSGLRWVQLYEANPGYKTRGQRLLQEGAALAMAAVAGSGVVGFTLYGTLKPQDAAKVKGLALSIAVPHCAEHVNTPPEGILGLVEGRIRVRDTGYARVIARINNPTINLLTLTGLVWPQQCLVCGAPEANERYQAKVIVEGATASQSESMEAPLCANDLNKVNRLEKSGTIILITGLLAAVGVGGLTFVVHTGLVAHLMLFTCGGLLGGLLWAGVLSAIVARVLGVSGLHVRPVRITLKDKQYWLEFQNVEMAETVRQINGLIEST